jgi:hypothetical protein
LSFGERLLSGLRTIVLIEERTKLLDERLAKLESKVAGGLAAHESRLVRLETIIEITRPDGAVLRLAPNTVTDISTK